MFSSDSRVCSSIIDAILMALPSMVESNWKSIAHTTFGASASTGGIEDTPARLRGLCTRTCRPFLAPQPVDLLLVDLTALVVAQRRPGPPEPMARMFGGVGAQPGPHLGIRIGRGLRHRQASVGGAGQPNGLARQPLRHAQVSS